MSKSNRKIKNETFRQAQRQRQWKMYHQRQHAFNTLIADIEPKRILYLTLDIGKNVHWTQAVSGSGKSILKPHRLLSNNHYYRIWKDKLLTWLDSGRFDLVVFGHEPTGIYHESWCRAIFTDFETYIHQNKLLYRFLNPYQVKLERQKITLRAHKNDRLDLQAMDALLRQGQGYKAVVADQHTVLLRQYVQLAHNASIQLRNSRIEILREFDRIWPGGLVNLNRFEKAHDLDIAPPIVKSKPFERKTFRLLLEHCPDPYRIRRLGEQGIINLFHHHKLRCGPFTAQRILNSANVAQLQPQDYVKLYLPVLEDLRLNEEHWNKRLTNFETTLDDLANQTDAQYIMSIPGISPRYAACYLSLVGSPLIFDWPDQIWKYVGFDPIEKQSGDSNPNIRYKISRRGSPFYRHVLTWSATLAAGHHPDFGRTFIEAEERGIGLWGAAMHTAHRFNRLCFRLLADKRPFNDNVSAEERGRWRKYWLEYRQHKREPKKYPHPGNFRRIGE